jgi:uncharacterized linocin/CFP29 family protein
VTDPGNAIPWTERQWDELRAVALESARKSRVASTFLPLVGPITEGSTTVQSNWLSIESNAGLPYPAADRLDVRAGKNLHLVTLSCNIYLRGSEISDPHLDAAKAMARRAGAVLGRLEDAVVFHGIARNAAAPTVRGRPVVQPNIYTVTGGSDLTGLLGAPETLLDDESRRPGASVQIRNARTAAANAARFARQPVGLATIFNATRNYFIAERQVAGRLMCVTLTGLRTNAPIVDAIVNAILKLEDRGHFGPFAVVLGDRLFASATSPSRSLVLPSDRLAEFLDGRRILRSSILPAQEGVVVALGGQPIELVLATDVDVRFLQVTLEPRYVLRVFERLVLRIKELDAVCRIKTGAMLLDPFYEVRAARS